MKKSITNITDEELRAEFDRLREELEEADHLADPLSPFNSDAEEEDWFESPVPTNSEGGDC